ncbi:MAG: methionyl-tRNA formyltransferase [Lachnospiraceae bacterium]|nr:MAG: methionyl-tRNA formyltransferase [Lachnospiraceae bacterium]
MVFMGTPDFAVQPLKALIENGHEIALVVTKEDKPKGRGYEMSFTPVKEEALANGIEIFQPTTLNTEEVYEKLKSIDAELYVVVAYGKILPQKILDLPRLGCINIHASLLPSYRGAAPIQWAIIDGCKKTGITTMLMDSGLDTGDILKKYEINIEDDETGGSLFEKLALLGAKAIVDTIENLDNIVPVKQKDTDTKYASVLQKSMGNIDFSKDRDYIERLVRGLSPWPGAYSSLRGKNIKLLKVSKVDVANIKYKKEDYGRLISTKNNLYVVCKGGLLEILNLQLAGKKAMQSSEFLRGFKPEEDWLKRG